MSTSTLRAWSAAQRQRRHDERHQQALTVAAGRRPLTPEERTDIERRRVAWELRQRVSPDAPNPLESQGAWQVRAMPRAEAGPRRRRPNSREEDPLVGEHVLIRQAGLMRCSGCDFTGDDDDAVRHAIANQPRRGS